MSAGQPIMDPRVLERDAKPTSAPQSWRQTQARSTLAQAQPLTQIVFILRRDGGVQFHRSRGDDDDATPDATIYDYILPEQYSLVESTLARVFVQGESTSFELHGLRPGDLDAWFLCRAAPTFREGRAVSCTLVATDITLYKQREVELTRERDDLLQRVSQNGNGHGRSVGTGANSSSNLGPDLALLAATTDLAGDAFFLTDVETGKLVAVNQTACRWLGSTRENLLLQSPEQVGAPFARLPAEATGATFVETRAAPRPIVVEGSCRRQDGSLFAVESAITVITVSGRNYALAVVREIERRSNEHDELQDVQSHYQVLFEQAGDAVFLATRGGQILDSNPATARLFGYEREKLIGLDARKLFRNPENVGRAATEGRTSGANTSILGQRQDGTTFSAVILATPLRGHRGAVRGYQCVVIRSDVDGSVAAPLVEPVAEAAPAAAPESTPEPSPQPPAPEPAVEVPLGERKVLLVSSNPDLIGQAREALGLVGINVTSVSDAPATAEYLRTHRNAVSVVVIDFLAGQPLGHGALRAALAAWPKLPVVVLGSESDLTAAQRLTLTSSVTFMPRPLHPLALIQRVRQLSPAEG
jgi:PAS domain S-box-containing protein